MDAVVAPDGPHGLERPLLEIDRLGDRSQHAGFSGMHGQDDNRFFMTPTHRSRQAAVAHRDSNPQRDILRQRPPAEAGALQEQAIRLRQFRNRHIAAIHGQHAMVAGDADPIAGLGGQFEYRLVAGREDLRDQMRLAIRPDNAGGLAHEFIDPSPAVGRRHQRLAGDAGIGGIDSPVRGTSVPFVDRRVVLHAGVGADPGGPGDLVPNLAGLHGLGHLPVGAPLQRPLPVLFQDREELVGHAHAVVGVLSGDGLVGLAVPVDVVFMEDKVREAFPRIGEHALDIGLRHGGLSRRADGLPQ